MTIQKVALIGMGAMGMLTGQHIIDHAAPETLCVVADPTRIARYRTEGLTVNGKPYDFHFVTSDEAPAEAVDLAVFAVKYGGLSDAIESMRPFMNADTTIVSVLNGIASEEDLAEAFSAEQVLYTIAQGMDATRVGSDLRYSVAGLWEIGVRDAAQQPRLDALRVFLDQVHIKYTQPTNIIHNLWSKLMLNSGVNQVLALYGHGYGTIHHEGEARDLMIASMREVIRVANAQGIALGESDLQGYLAVLDQLSPNGKPSMLQDVEAGRGTEVALFSGTVRKLGAKYGIPTPVNDMLFEKISALPGHDQSL